MTTSSAENERTNVTERQCRKYDQLENEIMTRRPPSLNLNKVVVNHSDATLSESTVAILAKGGNFAITPRTIPTEEIIANVEGSLRNLSVSNGEEVRQEVCRILKKAKIPKQNITRAERQALKELRNNPDIIVLPADKGNATVVLNTNDYEKKLGDLLTPDIYVPTTKDPTAAVERKTIQLLKLTSWETTLIKQLQPSDSRPPRLYGLPKIHKNEVPLRPIVSSIGSPTYNLAKHLRNLMREYEENSIHQVKNSSHFISILKDITLKETDILVSFDVVSLFTMVPVKDTLRLLSPLFSPVVIKLFEHCLTSAYFLWNGVYYHQTDGVAMGNPLSPVMANFYMQHFEEKALATAPLKPTHWFRYVDDTFVIWPHGRNNLDLFLAHLNSCHPNIQFTMEIEKEKTLAFLDVLITKKSTGQLSHSVYRKPTHTDRYLQAKSNHHPAQKRSVIKTLVHRAKTISDPEHLQEEIQHLTGALEANGYNRKDIQRAIKPRKVPITTTSNPNEATNQTTAVLPYIKGVTDRISKVLRKKNIKSCFLPSNNVQQKLRTAKDKLNPLYTPGIYRIPCECGKDYIGMTKRTISTRIKEHERAIRLQQPEKSAIAEHFLEEGHNIMFKDTAVLARTTGFYNLARREALEIEQHPLNLNKDDGLRLSRTWKPVLRNKQLNRKVTPAVTNQETNDGPTSICNANDDDHSDHEVSPIRRMTRARASELRLKAGHHTNNESKISSHDITDK